MNPEAVAAKGSREVQPKSHDPQLCVVGTSEYMVLGLRQRGQASRSTGCSLEATEPQGGRFGWEGGKRELWRWKRKWTKEKMRRMVILERIRQAMMAIKRLLLVKTTLMVVIKKDAGGDKEEEGGGDKIKDEAESE
jgi:hypothetical protein